MLQVNISQGYADIPKFSTASLDRIILIQIPYSLDLKYNRIPGYVKEHLRYEI